ELNPVVAVGYGTQRKADLTGSVGSVASKDIQTIPVALIDQAIAGLVSGVQVQTTNAQPGSVMRLRVRGGNSIQGTNDPLVVVDGVIGADLDQISPGDIESVDVLKEPGGFGRLVRPGRRGARLRLRARVTALQPGPGSGTAVPPGDSCELQPLGGKPGSGQRGLRLGGRRRHGGGPALRAHDPGI